MIGLAFIKRIIIDNSNLLNKDLEKGNYEDCNKSILNNNDNCFNTNYNYNITIITDSLEENKYNNVNMFEEIL